MTKNIWLLSVSFLLMLVPLVVLAQQDNTDKKLPDYSLMERKDIPVESTWRIEDIYPSLESWQADKQAVAKLIAAVEPASRGWTESPAKMLVLLRLLDEISLKGSWLYSYAGNQSNVDLGNQIFQAMRGELQMMFVQFNSQLAFFNPDVLALGGEKFAAYLKTEPGLKPYRFGIEEVLRGRDHVLPSDQQRIVSLTGLFGSATGEAAGMLNDVELPPAEATLSEGQKATLNFATFQRLRAAKNPEDRRLVMDAFWQNQKKFENTLAILQDGGVKRHLFDAQVRKFKDCLTARLFSDNIPEAVYFQLIKAVRKNLGPLHRFLELKRRLLGLDKYRYYDIYASAVKKVDKQFSVDDARQMITRAMKPMGPEYGAALKRAFANRWMDLYPNKGKESGAYSGGIYGVHPYIKLNFDGKYDDVSTMAHELGHAMHSHFSNKNQPQATAEYATFLAEVASAFNQNMLMQDLLKTEKDDLFKLFVLDSYLDGVRGTLYRQTLFAEFELAMHRLAEEGKTLTADWLNRKYLELTREYYGHDKGVCEVGDYIKVEWSLIPHFYMNYYVFQYSTGLIASMALSDMVLSGDKDAQKRYLEFLSAGGSDHPIAILKKAGVDMTADEAYQAAFRRINALLDEMEKIVARLQKRDLLK